MTPRTSRHGGLLAFLLVVGFGAIGLPACGGQDDSDEATPQTPTAPQATATDDVTITGETTSTAEATCPSGARLVPAQSNIFGAGGSEFAAPAPGGGGGGTPPPEWKIPQSAKEVSFPYVEGQVTPIVSGANERDLNGPGGDGEGPTDIDSYGGISGIVHQKNGMFLVGVFLTRRPPADPAPPRLDFSKREGFNELAPKIAQTFFVGDGKDRVYRVPDGATRLFLGFADGAFYQGPPGFYSNNSGQLCVQVEAA